MRQEGSRDIHQTRHVRRVLPLDLFVRGGFERSERSVAGVVDQDVHLPESGNSRVERRANRLAIRDVQRHRLQGVRNQIGVGGWIAHRRHYVPTFVSKMDRGDTADSRGRTGDEYRRSHSEEDIKIPSRDG